MMRNTTLASSSTTRLAEGAVDRRKLSKLANLLVNELSQDDVPLCNLRVEHFVKRIVALLSDALAQERRERHAELIASHFAARGVTLAAIPPAAGPGLAPSEVEDESGLEEKSAATVASSDLG